MLKLVDIRKDYVMGSSTVHALRGVDIEFGTSEFVAILGASGCGKTTLLNIVGGLDRYTSGDLIIDGISTKKFKDRDWDSYRNHKVGFVFQSYNLIPHQTVLANVELALTLSGVSKSERRRRAEDVLKKVGLADQINKKPNQLSGGQMQRVAIARALVNDPEIILADEPTGALDSETSVQVLELLREIASDKLIIMVTHNGELAEKYATRIIRLLDGCVISDTADKAAAQKQEKPVKQSSSKKKHVSMSFFTALSLSLNNLMTKKGRTILTAFAGSIGIIGIALILSISDGFQNYIDRVQEDTLSSYPLTIESEVLDMSSMLTESDEDMREEAERDDDLIYSSDILGDMLQFINSKTQSNDLSAFKEYIESGECDLSKYANSVQYSYDVDIYVYNTSAVGGTVQANPGLVYDIMFGSQMSGLMSMGASDDVFDEMIDNKELLDAQYDILAGKWPTEFNEVVLVVDRFNQIDDYTLYTLGLKDQAELAEIVKSISAGGDYEREKLSFTYEELMNIDFSLVLPSDLYAFDEESGLPCDIRTNEAEFEKLLGSAVKLEVVGIIRPTEGVAATAITGAIGYLPALTEYVINEVNASEIVKRQLDYPDIDVFTGIAFESDEADEYTPTIDEVMNHIYSLPEDEQETILPYLSMMTEEQIIEQFKAQITPPATTNTYEGNLSTLGVADLDSPSAINIYPIDFASKDEIKAIIGSYNDRMTAEGNPDLALIYTDYVGVLMGSISTIVDVISYVLIAFVAVSLVVSSIMIGVITNISVLERTKEIGILRSIGASKKDISRVFNAETLIIGFVSGIIGVGITLLLILPINAIIELLGGIKNVAALPWKGAIILLLISMALTLIAGLIPSRSAAKKDPVVALRTE